MKLAVLFTSFLLLSTVAEAQTTKLQWDHVGATPAQVATFNPQVRMDGVLLTGTPTCVARGSDTMCEFVLPTVPAGTRTFTVSTLVDNILREVSLSKLFPLTTPTGSQPTSPRFTITIIITGN